MTETDALLLGIANAIEELAKAVDRVGIRIGAIDPKGALDLLVTEVHEAADMVTVAIERLSDPKP
jgi:uncharacterized Fe-S cluster-containing radical SAM superfamily enzyme